MPRKYHQMSIGSSATSLPADVIENNSHVLIDVETAAIRFRLDGVAPTTTVGHKRSVGESFQLSGPELSSFQAIREGSTDATIHISAWRQKTSRNDPQMPDA